MAQPTQYNLPKKATQEQGYESDSSSFIPQQPTDYSHSQYLVEKAIKPREPLGLIAFSAEGRITLEASLVSTWNQNGSIYLQCRLPRNDDSEQLRTIEFKMLSNPHDPRHPYGNNLGNITLKTNCQEESRQGCPKPTKNNGGKRGAKQGNFGQGYIIGDCDWFVQCTDNSVSVSLKADVIDHSYLDLLTFKCAEVQHGAAALESSAQFLHPTSFCDNYGRVLVFGGMTTQRQYVSETRGGLGASITDIRTMQNQKPSIVWYPSSTICLWLKVKKVYNSETVYILSTLTKRPNIQSLLNNKALVNQYQVTVSFAENFKRLDIRFGLSISYMVKNWYQKTVSLYSNTQYDWDILSYDNSWHLLCLSYDLRRNPKKVKGYFDGRFVAEGILPDINLELESGGATANWMTKTFKIYTYGLGQPKERYIADNVFDNGDIYSFKVFREPLTTQQVSTLYNNYCGAYGDVFDSLLSGPFTTLSVVPSLPPNKKSHISIATLPSPASTRMNLVESSMSAEYVSYNCTVTDIYPSPLLLWKVSNVGVDGSDRILGIGIPGWEVNLIDPGETSTFSKGRTLLLTVSYLPDNKEQNRLHRLFNDQTLQCILGNHELYGRSEDILPGLSTTLELLYGATEVELRQMPMKNGLGLRCTHDGTNPAALVRIYNHQHELIHESRGGSHDSLVKLPPSGDYMCKVTNGEDGIYSTNSRWVTIRQGHRTSNIADHGASDADNKDSTILYKPHKNPIVAFTATEKLDHDNLAVVTADSLDSLASDSHNLEDGEADSTIEEELDSLVEEEESMDTKLFIALILAAVNCVLIVCWALCYCSSKLLK